MVANILAPVIVRLFDRGLAELIEDQGTIILSGILEDQAERVIEAGQAKRLDHARETSNGGLARFEDGCQSFLKFGKNSQKDFRI